MSELAGLSAADQIVILQKSLENDRYRFACESSLSEFFKFVWVELKPGELLAWGPHLDHLCHVLEAFYRREFQRLIINIPPRCTKSLLFSVAYPLWVWIQDGVDANHGGPGHNFLTLSSTEGLASDMPRFTRQVLQSEKFQELWGKRVAINPSQNEKSKYELTGGGIRSSFGINSRFTGKGGHTIIIDDPNDIGDTFSEANTLAVHGSYGAVISRANDPNTVGVCLVQQRISEMDLTGYVTTVEGLYHPVSNPRGWMHVCLPMEFEVDSSDPDEPKVNPSGQWGFPDWRTVPGELLWPSRFSAELLEFMAEQQYKGRDSYEYAGQMQQRPAPVAGGIIKKNLWNRWPSDLDIPHMDHIFLSWDTAFTEASAKGGDFSAMTAWGVFYHQGMQTNALMALGAWWGQLGLPDLKKKMREQQVYFNADAHFIEKAASGHSIIQELKRTYTPTGSRVMIRTLRPQELGDKIARAHAASNQFHGGLIFVPSPKHTDNPDNKQLIQGELNWVKDLIRYVSMFPNGKPPCKDITDTVTQACYYLVSKWWVSHPDDEKH